MHSTESMTVLMTRLVFQLAVIIITSRITGFLVKKFLRQPAIIGELLSGMIIGPYALGSLPLHFGSPLFPLPATSGLPISPELYGFATFASIILLFMSGLETDLKTFLRFATTGSLVGLGGFVCTFVLGTFSVVLLVPDVGSIMAPQALFMGVIATATSVGITARILSEQKKISSPEGVTILSSAVVDDVLGIILLSIVAALAKTGSESGLSDANWTATGKIALKAFGFWIGSTALGIFLAPRLSHMLKKLIDLKSLAIICLGLALLLAGLSELAGLAMIIGAYITGLAFSKTDVSEDILQRMSSVRETLVPVFFCVMGMLVDFLVFPEIFFFGLIYTFLSLLAKFLGCGLPALLLGFNLKGAFRIGSGMLPRGEVTLIIAGFGLVNGAIGRDLFGVAIMTMFITSLLSSPIIVKAFSGGSGFKKQIKQDSQTNLNNVKFAMPNVLMTELVSSRILNAFRRADFFPRRIGQESHRVYAIQKDDSQLGMSIENCTIRLNIPEEKENFVRLLITEELVSIKEMLRDVEKVFASDLLGKDLLSGIFDQNDQQ